MTRSFDQMLVQEYRGRGTQEILAATPAALKGLSEQDAQHLSAAFGINDIASLARNRFFRQAQAILAATGSPGFDPGPSPEWETFFDSAPLDHYIRHPARRFRLEFGPVYYRGRLDGSARLIVVGQDPSTNEILAQRAFVGRSGQRIQGFLKKLGLTRSYVMLNTFLFSVFGQFNAQLRSISEEAPILDYRNTFLDRLTQSNPIEAVVAVGSGAAHAVREWPGSSSLPVFNITHPAAHDVVALLASWSASLPGLMAVVVPDDDGQPDATPYGPAFQPQDEVAIPRFDLAFGIPEWHGKEGGDSHRDGDNKIVWTAP